MSRIAPRQYCSPMPTFEREGVVVVFSSADPDYFIAHADGADILALKEDLSPPSNEIVGLQRLRERWRTCSKPTIAQVEGRTRGGGSEFVLSLDMRFAAIGAAVLCQPEAAVGIIAAGSGTQRLAELCGRDRALEIALGCADFDASWRRGMAGSRALCRPMTSRVSSTSSLFGLPRFRPRRLRQPSGECWRVALIQCRG
jgi:hypothetical protein